MYSNLQSLNISFDKNKEILFDSFIEYFIEYNKKVNLISKNDEKVLFEKHIFDSLAINLFLQKYESDKDIKILDIGTGGGFPAVPVAMNYKNINVVAVDSILKKIKFIESISEKFNLNNLNPVCKRVEELPFEYKNGFDVVTTRAMAELRVILEYGIPFVKKGGFFVAYKSIKAEEEINNAKNALDVMNSKIIDIIDYSLPLKEENKRVLIIIKKNKEIPDFYPRSNGLVKKKPL